MGPIAVTEQNGVALTPRAASAQDLFTHPPQDVPLGWAPSNDVADKTSSMEVLVLTQRVSTSHFYFSSGSIVVGGRGVAGGA